MDWSGEITPLSCMNSCKEALHQGGAVYGKCWNWNLRRNCVKCSLRGLKSCWIDSTWSFKIDYNYHQRENKCTKSIYS